MNTEPFIGVVCDSSFSALVSRIKGAGYRVARVSPQMLKPGSRPSVDVWVIDCEDSDAVADDLADIDSPVVALSNRPSPADDKDGYRHWGDRILRTLDRWTADAWHRQASVATSRPEHFAAVKGVWLLAGSAGMESAVAEFFLSMPRVPPVAFLYAQHVEPDRESRELALANRLNRACKGLQCTLARGRHWLNPGQMLVVPASARVQFGAHGEVFSLRENWEGRTAPHIDQLMMALTGIKPSGVIVFSGASTDALKGAQALRAIGTAVWSQEPETATEPGLPKWVDRLHLSSNVGTPAELAGDLLARYPHPRHAGAERAGKASGRDKPAPAVSSLDAVARQSRRSPAGEAASAASGQLALQEGENAAGHASIPLPEVAEITAEEYPGGPLSGADEGAADVVQNPQPSPPLLEPTTPARRRSFLGRTFGGS